MSEIDNVDSSRVQNKIKDLAVKNIAKLITAKMNKLSHYGLYKMRLNQGVNNVNGSVINILAVALFQP